MPKMGPVEKMTSAGVAALGLAAEQPGERRPASGVHSPGEANSPSIHSHHPGLTVSCKILQVP